MSSRSHPSAAALAICAVALWAAPSARAESPVLKCLEVASGYDQAILSLKTAQLAYDVAGNPECQPFLTQPWYLALGGTLGAIPLVLNPPPFTDAQSCRDLPMKEAGALVAELLTLIPLLPEEMSTCLTNIAGGKACMIGTVPVFKISDIPGVEEALSSVLLPYDCACGFADIKKDTLAILEAVAKTAGDAAACGEVLAEALGDVANATHLDAAGEWVECTLNTCAANPGTIEYSVNQYPDACEPDAAAQVTQNQQMQSQGYPPCSCNAPRITRSDGVCGCAATGAGGFKVWSRSNDQYAVPNNLAIVGGSCLNVQDYVKSKCDLNAWASKVVLADAFSADAYRVFCNDGAHCTKTTAAAAEQCWSKKDFYNTAIQAKKKAKYGQLAGQCPHKACKSALNTQVEQCFSNWSEALAPNGKFVPYPDDLVLEQHFNNDCLKGIEASLANFRAIEEEKANMQVGKDTCQQNDATWKTVAKAIWEGDCQDTKCLDEVDKLADACVNTVTALCVKAALDSSGSFATAWSAASKECAPKKDALIAASKARIRSQVDALVAAKSVDCIDQVCVANVASIAAARQKQWVDWHRVTRHKNGAVSGQSHPESDLDKLFDPGFKSAVLDSYARDQRFAGNDFAACPPLREYPKAAPCPTKRVAAQAKLRADLKQATSSPMTKRAYGGTKLGITKAAKATWDRQLSDFRATQSVAAVARPKPGRH